MRDDFNRCGVHTTDWLVESRGISRCAVFVADWFVEPRDIIKCRVFTSGYHVASVWLNYRFFLFEARTCPQQIGLPGGQRLLVDDDIF